MVEKRVRPYFSRFGSCFSFASKYQIFITKKENERGKAPSGPRILSKGTNFNFEVDERLKLLNTRRDTCACQN